MLLLDGLCHHDSQGAICTVKIQAHSPFVKDGRVPAVVAIEYLAQCVAAFATLHPQGAGVEPPAPAKPAKPRIGYLVGVRRLDLAVAHFSVGDELRVSVKHVWGAGQGAQFTGTVQLKEQTVATGSLTVVVPPEQEGAL